MACRGTSRRAARVIPGGTPAHRLINAAENTIARSWGTTYHGCMTTWQATKRGGCMDPISQLAAALIGLEYGVFAV